MAKSNQNRWQALGWSLISSLICVTPLTAMAIRHVGNGGGEAELRILQMKEVLPYWMKACQETSCWNGGEFPKTSQAAIANLKLQFSEQNLPNGTDRLDTALTLDNRHLYLADAKTPRSDLELASLLIQAVMEKVGIDLPKPLVINLLPLGTQVQADGKVSVLRGIDTDVMTGLNDLTNWHSQFLAQTGCRSYRLFGVTAVDWKLRCDDGVTYAVTIDRLESPAKLHVYVDTEVSDDRFF